MHNYHRVWAEVNLDAIRANMETFRDNVPKEAMLCGVIKTDGNVWEPSQLQKQLMIWYGAMP